MAFGFVNTQAVQEELQRLKASLDVSTNETETNVRAIFAAANAETSKKLADLASKVGTGKLDDILPNEMSVLERLSFFITKMKMDYDLGRYDPEFLLVSRASEDKLSSIQNTLMDIHRFALVKQRYVAKLTDRRTSWLSYGPTVLVEKRRYTSTNKTGYPDRDRRRSVNERRQLRTDRHVPFHCVASKIPKISSCFIQQIGR